MRLRVQTDSQRGDCYPGIPGCDAHLVEGAASYRSGSGLEQWGGDSGQTLLCTYLSAVLLAGVVLNATLGWSWADPAAGLVIAAVAVREAREAWNGEGCGCLPESTTQYADDSATGQAGEHCDDACCNRSQVAVSGADR